MCHVIESEYILTKVISQKSKCSIADLNERKDQIESSLPGVYVDVSRCSVETSVVSYSDYFSFEEDDDDNIIGISDSYERLLKLAESNINSSILRKLEKLF